MKRGLYIIKEYIIQITEAHIGFLKEYLNNSCMPPLDFLTTEILNACICFSTAQYPFTILYLPTQIQIDIVYR